MGAQLTVNGTCYRQVHPEEHNVYDFGYWTTRHPGNGAQAAQGLPNPIMNPARLGEHRIRFPSTHGLDRWMPTFSARNLTPLLRLLGIYGQEVEFADLPTTVQVKWLADAAGVVDNQDGMLNLGNLQGMQREACGSAGEVENRVELGHKYGGRYSWTQKPTYEPTEMLWVNAVFHADDQLRQRVAWALSQIYVVSKIGFAASGMHPEESFAAYYDIFVRHAFGNFGELLKDVAYSNQMGTMLTFINSQSAASSGNFADENFARESIQLFTVGLYHLNSDGTPVLDDAGTPKPAYDVKDVASFARAWTGFVADSGNLRTNSISGAGHIDPMKISPAHRDASPKMDLFDGFIGDGFPVCTDLPTDLFLRKGTRYTFLGGALTGADAKGEPHVVALSLDDPASPLFRELCASADSSATPLCAFPDEVILPETLPCHGVECNIDLAQYVQVTDADGRAGYYQVVPPACTNFLFFQVGALVKYGVPWHNDMSCSDAKALAAAPVCCNAADIPDGDPPQGVAGAAICEYSQERVSYGTAVDRCAALGTGLCSGIDDLSSWGQCHPYSKWRFSTWLSRPCSTQVQIQRDGRVNVVHVGKTFTNPSAATNSRIEPEEFASVISIGSRSIFDVIWHENAFPRAESNCSNVCVTHGESCVCEVEVEASPVFTNASRIPTRSEVLQRLHIGAVHPESYDRCVYSKCTSALCNASSPEVQVWIANTAATASENYNGSDLGLVPDWHLAPAGAHACDSGISAAQAQCEAAVLQLARAAGASPSRTLQVSSHPGSCGVGWGAVPLGCSTQSGGDWAGHYKTAGDTGTGCINSDYQLVCSGAAIHRTVTPGFVPSFLR